MRLCEMGTADAFRRLLAGQNFHYLLTSATAVVLANVLVLLLQKLYSKAAADALQEAVKAAQAKNAPRNVRLYVAWCVGRALRACGHQLRPLHARRGGRLDLRAVRYGGCTAPSPRPRGAWGTAAQLLRETVPVPPISDCGGVQRMPMVCPCHRRPQHRP